MFTEAHGAIGWMLGEAGKEDASFRRWVFLSSVLPDADAISFLHSSEAYIKYHHVICHNLLFSLLLSASAAIFCKAYRVKVFIFTQLGFLSHYFGDYFFTKFDLYYFWPFSDQSFISWYAVPLDHPINKILFYLAIASFVLMSWWNKRTPLEVISTRLDQKIVTSFSQVFKRNNQ